MNKSIRVNGIILSLAASALVLAMVFSGLGAPAPRTDAAPGDERGRDLEHALAQRFHVQAGAFSVRDNAVALQTELQNRGYAATLINGELYRVWVGGYLDRATAERLASHLSADGFDQTLTRREK